MADPGATPGVRLTRVRWLAGIAVVLTLTVALVAAVTGQAQAAPLSSQLSPGAELLPGSSIESPGGADQLTMQPTGNLTGTGLDGQLWATNTNSPGAYLVNQPDGDLVLVTEAGAPTPIPLPIPIPTPTPAPGPTPQPQPQPPPRPPAGPPPPRLPSPRSRSASPTATAAPARRPTTAPAWSRRPTSQPGSPSRGPASGSTNRDGSSLPAPASPATWSSITVRPRPRTWPCTWATTRSSSRLSPAPPSGSTPSPTPALRSATAATADHLPCPPQPGSSGTRENAAN